MTASDTPTHIETTNIAQTMRDTVEELGKVQHIHAIGPDDDFDLSNPRLISIPKHREVRDITPEIRKALTYLRPARRTGTATLKTLASLIDWANHFSGDASVLYADPEQAAPSLTCIANYHKDGPPIEQNPLGDDKAAHCDHRGTYKFPLSKEWQKWKSIDGKPLEKDEMGYFLENNAKDMVDPTPYLINGTGDPEPWEERLTEIAKKINGRFGQVQELMAISREFRVNETSNYELKTNRDTGEATIRFQEEHTDIADKPISLPNLFLIAIPVFDSGTAYRLPVRFNYRKGGGNVRFTLTIYDPDKAFDDAFKGAVDQAQEATGLPLFLGTPETATR